MEKFLKFANISTTSNIVKDRWKELYMKMAKDIDSSIELLTPIWFKVISILLRL